MDVAKYAVGVNLATFIEFDYIILGSGVGCFQLKDEENGENNFFFFFSPTVCPQHSHA